MPSVSLSLDWQGDLKFSNSVGSPSIQLDSDDPAVSSPPQALAYATMACMAMDVVHILQKGRHDVKAMKIAFDGQRAEEHPRRYTAMHIRFEITGDVPDGAVARAIELSHEKYCSVSNTLRTDLDFKTSFTITR